MPSPRWSTRRVLVACLVGIALTGCSDDGGASGSDATVPSTSDTGAPSVDPSVGQRIDEEVDAVLGGVDLRLEVADEPAERATGLMGRSEVPDGTGMVFLFDGPTSSRFYMFQVPIPLRAVFVREGAVVGVVDMEPCTESDAEACPLYGPDAQYDTVVETAPEALPDVEVGDRLEPARPGE